MPDVDETKRRQCQHIEYRAAKWYEKLHDIAPGYPVALVCLTCGKKLWW